MKKIAFLGIGAMGERIATNLIKAGYELQVWNRTQEKCQRLVEMGAKVCDSPRKAVENVDVAISMLTDDQASREVWLNETTGAVYGLRENAVSPKMRRCAIAIEYSTLSPNWCRELAGEISKHNCEFIDAPVVGSRPQAEAGTLIHLVGGQADSLAQVRDILNASSSAIHHVGEVGMGMTIKLAVNGLFGIQVAALGEVLGVLQRAGMSVESAVNLLNEMPITSPALKGIGALIASENYAPLFPIDLVEKDMRYLEQLGISNNSSISIVTAIKQIYQEAQRSGYGDNNITGVAQLYL